MSESLTEEQYTSLLDSVIEQAESSSNPAIGETIYWNPGDQPTVGYGYNLEAQGAADVNSDFAVAGIDVSPDELSQLDDFLNDLTSNPTEALTIWTNNNKFSDIVLTQAQQTTLVNQIATPERQFSNIASWIPEIPVSTELVAIEDLDYNTGSYAATIAEELADGERATAWFTLRYLDNFYYNNPNATSTAYGIETADGIAARRYEESQLLDLYGADVDPNGTGTPNFALVSSTQALHDVSGIFAAYSQYFFNIVEYDGALGDDVNVANSNYGAILDSVGINSIQSTDSAMMPAFDYLSVTFAEGVYIPGDPDANQVEQHQGALTLDQFNVYVDPNQPGGHPGTPIVTLSAEYSGNYIFVEPNEGVILEGKTGIVNVFIAEDGNDTIDPGSTNDIVWGAPGPLDQNLNPLLGSVLDLSGETPGSAQLFGSTIKLSVIHVPKQPQELDVISGNNTLKSFYITTIVGGLGLDVLDLSLEDTSSNGNSYSFSSDGHGGFVVTDSNGLDVDVVGFNTIQLGDGNDTVYSNVEDLTISFGNGSNDTLLHAGQGSVVEAGLGSDTFNISNDVLITGAGPQDRIEYNGSDVYGALAWNSTQGGWAVNDQTGVAFGINQQGELVIRSPGATPSYMYASNFVDSTDQASNEFDIFAGVASEHAYRLLGPHPNVDFVWSQFNLANAEYKVDKGTNYWPGADPLVLDLTGNGLDLIGESQTSPMFDIWGDGFEVHTGWVKPDDGMLVWDDNGTYELLGAGGTNGFAALAAAAGIDLDSLTSGDSADATIDSSSSIYSDLYVWQDLNGNGVMDPGELESLSQLGIASINVDATAQTDDVVAGNYITETSTFTYTDGETGEIADVSFITDNFHTQYTGDTTVSASAAAEPNLKGYGTLTDLQVAMTLDPSLISTVAAAMPSLDVVDLDTLRNAAMTVFSAWAAAVPLTNTMLAPGGYGDVNILVTSENGIPEVTDYAYQVTGTDPATGDTVTYWALASGTPVLDANGNVIEYPTLAQVEANPAAGSTWETITGAELDFVERYGGNPLDINLDPSDASGSLAVLGPVLTAAWNSLNLETVRLAMQGPLAPYFAGLSYDTTSDTFDVTTNEQLAPMFTAIFAAAPSDAADATAWINSWAPIINVIEGDLAPSQGLTATYGYLFASMVAAYEATSMPIDLQSVAEALGIPGDLIYDSGTTLQAATEDANILYASGGNQTINGSGGPDNDIFGSNFGNDVINNQNTNQTPDILWFATLNPDDITASRQGNNLILTNNATGAQITVLYEFIGENPTLFGQNLNPVTGVQQIVFADGTVWNFPDINYNAGLNTEGVNGTLVGATGASVLDGNNGNTLLEGQSEGDMYLYDIGDGNDTIDQYTSDILITTPDIVSFGANITPSNVTFSRDGESANLNVEFNDDPNDSLTVIGQFTTTYTGVFGTVNLNQISDFVFADGTTYSNAQIEQLIISAEEAIPYETIYAFEGDEVIDPGVGGNHYIVGSNGNQTFLYGMGYGNDTIFDGADNLISPRSDMILFNADLTPQDVTFTRNGDSNDLEIVIGGDTADTLTIQGQFDYTYTGVFGTVNFNQINYFQFADGTVYNADQIQQMVIQSAEQIPNNSIYGFGGNDVFDPGIGGNDWMSGGNGNDTYIFGLGYGHDTIYDGSNNLESPRSDTVLFNPGVNPDDVTVERNGGSIDVTLVLSDGSTLTILDQFDYINGSGFGIWTFNTIFNFQFQDANNTNWSYYDLENKAIAQQIATPGAAVYGFWTGNTIDPGTTGNHLMVADGLGANTYVFGLGYGHDTIDDNGHGEILFNADVDPAEVTFIRNDVTDPNDLTILLSDGSELDLRDEFNYQPFGLGDIWTNQLGTLQFQDANHTEITIGQIEQMLLSQEELVPDSTIEGFFGGSTLDGAAGNETLLGVNGNSTFLFGLGYGNEVVGLLDDGYYWDQRATGVVQFGAGILPGDVSLVTEAQTGKLQVDIAGSTDTLSIENYAGLLAGGRISFAFSDGTVLSSAEITTIIETNILTGELGTPGSTLSGPFPNNFVDPGVAGNHTMVGTGVDNTYAFGLGYGNDTIDETDGAGSEVLFNPDITPSAVTFSRGGTNYFDLTISLSDGSTLDIQNELGYHAFGFGDSLNDLVEYFQFQDADGTSLNLAQVENELLAQEEAAPGSTIYGYFGGSTLNGASGNDTLVGMNGANTVLFGYGDGQEYLSLYDDGWYYDQRATASVLFGAGVTAANITVVPDGSTGNLTVLLNGTTDSLTIENGSSLIQSGYLSFQFADGTVWTSQTITTYLETAQLDEEMAVSGQSLIGPFPNNYVDPGYGGGRTLNDEGYASTYVFGFGYGNDTIEDSSAGGSELLFAPGVTPSDVQFSRGGANFFDLTITLSDGSTLDIQNELGYHAFGFGDSLNYDVGTFKFQDAGQTTYSYNQLFALVMSQEEATQGSTVYGQLGGSTFSGAGDNTFVGMNGANTFQFGPSDGEDYVSLYDDGWYYAQRPSATIDFEGITAGQVTVYADGSSGNVAVQITGTNEFIWIDGGQGLASNQRLSFQFGDGVVWSGTEIAANWTSASMPTITLTASASNTTLVGVNDCTNIFQLAPGGDKVTFGQSDSGVLSPRNIVDYNAGDGAVSIALNGSSGTIVMGEGIAANDLYFQSDAAGDLTIGLLGEDGQPTSDSVVVPGVLYRYTNSSYNPAFGSYIPEIAFADGSSLAITGALTDTWFASASDTTLVGSNWAANLFELAPGNDAVTFGNGDGGIASAQNVVDYGVGDDAVTINLNGSGGTIVMGAGITKSDVIFQSDAAGDLTISLLGIGGTLTGDSMTIAGDLYLYDYNSYELSHVADVQFGDGSSLAINGALMDTWIASASDTTLVGSNWAANQFELAPGGDSVTFGHGNGVSSAQNIVDYGAGDGAATINLNGSNGTLVLGSGITVSDLIFQSDEAGDLTISLLGTGGTLTGDSVTIAGDLYLYDYNSYEYSHVADIEFADGSSLAITGALTDTWFASATDTTLVGSSWAANLFELAPGSDSITFGRSNGVSSAQNVVDYGIGDGAATINLNGSNGTIVMGAGITKSDLIFQTDTAGDLIISLLGTGGTLTSDSVTIAGDLYLYDYNSYELSHVVDVQFSDGGSLAINGALTDTWFASATDTTLVGSNWEANQFELAPGGDNVTFGRSNGVSNGQNTVDYGIGDGAATINLNGSNGTLVMEAGITKSDLIFQSDAAGDLTISLLGSGGALTGDSVTIAGDLYLYDYNSYEYSHVADIEFSDGSSLAITGALTDTWFASATDTTLVGSSWAANQFELAPGGDSITFGRGNGVSSSQNIVKYGAGDGAATINLNGSGGTIVMGTGITKSDVIFQSDAAGDLTISLLGSGEALTGDSMTIAGDLYLYDYNSYEYSHIADVLFDDGSTVAINGALMDTWIASASDTTLVGSNWAANLFELAPGGDSITFGRGNGVSSSQNIVDYGVGDGTATINLNGSSGTLVLGSGITVSDLVRQNNSGSLVSIDVLNSSGEWTGDALTFGTASGSLHIELANGTVINYGTLSTVNYATIQDAVGNQEISDETSVSPFEQVVISGTGSADSAEITLEGADGIATDENGTLSGTGLTEIAEGSYALSATSLTNLTSELEALTFTPAAHQVSPGDTVATDFILSVSQNGAVSVNTTTSMIAIAANDTPAIAGAVSRQLATDGVALDPFSQITITDPDYDVTDSLLIIVTGTGGIATDADGTLSGTSLTEIGVGTYSLAAATPVELTTELQALGFSPTTLGVIPGQIVTTDFTLAVTQDGVTAIDANTSVIAVDSSSPNIVNFGTGGGALTITSDTQTTVDLAAGISLADITLSANGAGDIILALDDGTDSLVFSNGVDNSAFQQLDFADGTSLSQSQILYTAETGTTGDDTITVPSGAEVIDGRGGNDVINGGGGYDTYIYRQGYGNLTINNAAGGGTVANGELDFGAGITEQDLWFSQNGENLEINVLGSQGQIVIGNWFDTANGAQLAEIKAYDGVEIDAGLNQLVAAMAVFQSDNSAFNPETALQMPNDPSLQAAIVAAWHQPA